MTSPDEIQNLEQQLSRALRAHGDSVEAAPDAYTRLVRAVDEAPVRTGRIRTILDQLGGDRPPGATDSLRPLAFLAAVLAVAGLGAYGLVSLTSSPAETATAAPATADVSNLVPRADESAADDESASIEADGADDTESSPSDSPVADNAGTSPRSSVPSDPASNGTAAATSSNPVERYAGLTYGPVRITALEAAEAFLDLLAIDEVELEERNDRVVVRLDRAASPAEAADRETILTTLSISAIGDGFMVVDARSDQLELSIDNPTIADPTDDGIVDGTVVTGPIELSGTTADPTADVMIALRSVVDGSVLAQTSTSPDSSADENAAYRSTVPIIGAERVWVVATALSQTDELRSVTARPVLYSGRPDAASYTVVGIPPYDPDGGLVVRSTPNGSRVGVLESGSTDVRRLPVPPRLVDDVVWWAVGDGSGLEGWAAARYLAVDETPAEVTMVELARAVIAAVGERDRSAVEAIGLSKPVFVGSIVDPRPMSGLADVDALLTTRRRLATGRLTDFYGFDRWSEAEVFVPKSYREDGAAEGARAYFGDLPSVVIRSLNPETGGWERVHLFVSRSGDRPALVGMVLEKEPISDSSTVPDESPPPSDTDD